MSENRSGRSEKFTGRGESAYRSTGMAALRLRAAGGTSASGLSFDFVLAWSVTGAGYCRIYESGPVAAVAEQKE
ncbi:MAG: hypothetical protein NVS2B16_08850 [Chloroflexota bacterium]